MYVLSAITLLETAATPLRIRFGDAPRYRGLGLGAEPVRDAVQLPWPGLVWVRDRRREGAVGDEDRAELRARDTAEHAHIAHRPGGEHGLADLVVVS